MTTTAFPVRTTTLGNGLTVVVSEDHIAPVVAVNLWYDVGSRHELPGRTGLAHLFEHLMFEGSRQVRPSEHFAVLAAVGGVGNATTSTERTNYFETVPAIELDTALWLEADRLGTLLERLSQASLDKQRDVVRNERRQRYDNVPYGTAFENLCRRLFPPDHPYAHQPIGSMEDLAAATLEDVRAFFRDHYAPNNLVLSIVGAVTSATAVERVEHYFGAIPSNPAIPDPPPWELERGLDSEDREHVLDRAPDPAVYLAFRLPPENDPRIHPVEVAFAALTSGRGSALHRGLVHSELAKSAGGGAVRRIAGASIGILAAEAAEGVPLEKLETALRNQLAQFAENGPTEAELGRAKAVIERDWLKHVAELEGRADELSRHQTLVGDAAAMNHRLVPAMNVSAEDVADAARDFLVDAHAAVLTYEPIAEEESP